MDRTEIANALRTARDALSASRWDDALATCQSILQHDKKNYNALVFTGMALANSPGKADKAELAYRKAIELQPANLVALQGLVDLFTKTAANDKLLPAIDACLKLIDATHAKYQDYLRRRALALEALGQADEARAAWTALLATLPPPAAPADAACVARLVPLEYVARLMLAADEAAQAAETEQRFVAAMKRKDAPQAADAAVALKASIASKVAVAALGAGGALDDVLDELRSLALPGTVEWTLRLVQRSLLRLEFASPADKPQLLGITLFLLRDAVLRDCVCLSPYIQLSMLLGDSPADETEAQHLAKRLVHAQPGHPNAMAALGCLLQRCGGPKRAGDAATFLELSLAAPSTAASAPRGWLALAELRISELAWKGALDAATRGLSCVSDLRTRYGVPTASWERRLRVQQADALVHLHELERASEILSRLAAEDPSDLNVVLVEGDVALARGRYAESEQFYQRVLGAKPTEHRALAQLAAAEAKQAKLEDAAKHYEAALRVAPSASYHFALAEVYWARGGAFRTDKKFAQMQLLLSAKLDPTHGASFRRLGDYYLQVDHDAERAKRCYQKALALDIHDDDAGVALANLYVAQKQGDFALALYRDVTQRSNKSTWAWRRLAFHHLNEQAYEEAVVAFNAALRVEPRDTSCWRGLGDAYRRLGKFIAAQKAFARMLELDPNSISARYHVAAVDSVLGDRVGAMQQYTAILAVQPDYLPALVGMAEASLLQARDHIEHGSFARALGFVEGALDTATRCAASHGSLGSIHKLLGDVHLLCAGLPYAYAVRLVPVEAQTDALKPPPPPPAAATSPQPSAEQRLAVALYFLQRAQASFARVAALSPSLAAHYDNALVRYEQALAHERAATNQDAQAARQLRLAAVDSLALALALEPESLALWSAVGVVHPSAAVRQHALLRAVGLHSKSPQAWANLGSHYLAHKQVALARQAYAHSQSMDPSHALSWTGQGMIAELRGAGDAEALEEARDDYFYCKDLHPPREARLGLGYAAFACGNTRAAASALRQYLDVDEEHAGAHNVLGLVLESQQKPEAALECFQRALALLPATSEKSSASTVAVPAPAPAPASGPRATVVLQRAAGDDVVSQCHSVLINLARVLSHLGRADEACAAYAQAGHALDHHALSGLAQAQFSAGKYADAMATFERALAGASSSPNAQKHVLLRMCQVAFLAGDAARAKAMVAQCVALVPGEADAHLCAFALAALQHDWADAEAALARLSALYRAFVLPAGAPRATRAADLMAELSLLRALLARLRDDVAGTRREICRAIHHAPHLAKTWEAFGSLLTTAESSQSHVDLLTLTGNYVPALASASSLLLVSGALMTMGKAPFYSSAQMLQQATSMSQTALHVSPASPQAWHHTALALFGRACRRGRRADYQTAQRLLRVALDDHQGPESLRSRLSLLIASSECASALGDAADAVKIATAAVAAAGPDNVLAAPALVQLGRAQLAAKKTDAALAALKQALVLDPTQLGTWVALAELYTRALGNEAAAEAVWRRSVQTLAPADGAVALQFFALQLHQQRRYDEALQALTDSSTLSPTDTSTSLLLRALVHARVRDWPNAEWQLQTALGMEPQLPYASLLLSQAHMHLNQLAAAESDALLERDSDPLNAFALFQSARVCLSAKVADAFRSFALRAVHADPSNGDLWRELAAHKLLTPASCGVSEASLEVREARRRGGKRGAAAAGAGAADAAQ